MKWIYSDKVHSIANLKCLNKNLHLLLLSHCTIFTLIHSVHVVKRKFFISGKLKFIWPTQLEYVMRLVLHDKVAEAFIK